MKPKQLKYPFSWEERKPCLHDRVLFVPEYFDKHHEWKGFDWHDEDIFHNNNPVHIEYCSGNGLWITERAKMHPDINYVAVEQRFDRSRKIWSKIKNFGIPNLLVVCGEAYTFTKFYVKDKSVDAVFVNFPDPWPKEKHAKHRLFHEAFILEMSRIMKKEQIATFVTDDETYSLQMIEEMKKSCHWHPVFSSPYYISEWPDYGTSYFDALWREKGRLIRYLQFSNQEVAL